METIDIFLTLDFREGRALKAVHLMQGDNHGSKAIYLSLTNGGDPVEISSSSDTAVLQAGTDDLILITDQNCTITNNMVKVNASAALTAVAGTVHCTVELSSGNGTAHTALFDIIVHRSPIDDSKPAIVSTSTIFSRLDDLDDRVTALEQGGGSFSVSSNVGVAEVIS